MMLQAYNGKFLTVAQNGLVVATATKPPQFSGPTVFRIKRVSPQAHSRTLIALP